MRSISIGPVRLKQNAHVIVQMINDASAVCAGRASGYVCVGEELLETIHFRE